MASRTSRRTEPAALLRSLERIFVPAPEHEDVLLDPAESCRLLRCEEGTLDALRAAGLPAYGAGADLRRCDVLNLGLYSGSGRTIPEVAEAHRVRFAAEPRRRWTEPRTWELSLELRCPRPGCGEGFWLLPPPSPQRFGGELLAWPGESLRAGSPLRFGARVALAGAEAAAAEPEAGRLFAELVAALIEGRLRYQYLPPALRHEPKVAAAHGVLDCLAASLLLGRRCAERGLESRTRKGLLLGSVGVEHVWLEVPAGGGGWAALDPVLAALVGRAGVAGFTEFAAGSVTNRLLPWERDAAGDLFRHSCGADGAERGGEQLLVGVSARPLAAAQPSG